MNLSFKQPWLVVRRVRRKRAKQDTFTSFVAFAADEGHALALVRASFSSARTRLPEETRVWWSARRRPQDLAWKLREAALPRDRVLEGEVEELLETAKEKTS